jgi:hypothetical protein
MPSRLQPARRTTLSISRNGMLAYSSSSRRSLSKKLGTTRSSGERTGKTSCRQLFHKSMTNSRAILTTEARGRLPEAEREVTLIVMAKETRRSMARNKAHGPKMPKVTSKAAVYSIGLRSWPRIARTSPITARYSTTSPSSTTNPV